MSNYILDGHTPAREPDIIKWATWFEKANRHVAKTEISKEVEVSTVFLGIDHSFGDGPPQLFETMVFGDKLDEYTERYSTWEEAEEGHKQMVKKAKGG